MLISQLFNGMDYKLIGEDINIKGLACDTAKVQHGYAFYCLKGSNVDGHIYAERAIQNGAKIVVCDHALNLDIPQVVVKDTRIAMSKSACNFYDNPRKSFKLIGVTGTNGKTTTTYMIKSILKQAGYRVGVIGTLGVDIDGVNKQYNMTTPDPIELHQIFSDMRDAKVGYVVMEVSAHAIALNKMAGVVCDVGLLTNVTQDHLDFFKTFENYANTKKKFINPEFCKIGVVNVDDVVGREIGCNDELRKDFKIALYGLYNPCDVFSPKYSFDTTGTRYILNMFDQLKIINTKLIGQFNLYNALGAGTTCCMLGINIDDIEKGLNNMEFVPGRFNVINLPNNVTAIVDYAHTPDGLSNILNAVREITNNKIISVFGCGGNRDSIKRPIMGRISGSLANYSIITSDNPRFEEPKDIISEIETGIKKVTQNYICIENRKDAIKYALNMAENGDVVVVSGKGAENYLDINGIKYPYNDFDTIQEQYDLLVSERDAKQC